MFGSKNKDLAADQQKRENHEKRRRENRERRQAAHDEFAQSCGLQPCSIETYATWLSSFVSNGGKIAYFRTSVSIGGLQQVTQSSDVDIPDGLSLVIPSGVTLTGDVAWDDHRSAYDYPYELLQDMKKYGYGHSSRYDMDRICRPWKGCTVYSFVDGKAWTTNSDSINCSPELINLLDMPRRHWLKLDAQLYQFEQKELARESESLERIIDPTAPHSTFLMEARMHRYSHAESTQVDDTDSYEGKLSQLQNDLNQTFEAMRMSHRKFVDCIEQNRTAIESMMR